MQHLTPVFLTPVSIVDNVCMMEKPGLNAIAHRDSRETSVKRWTCARLIPADSAVIVSKQMKRVTNVSRISAPQTPVNTMASV